MSDTPDPPQPPAPAGEEDAAAARSAVSDPAKLIRLGTMVQALMAEVRAAETDEESRQLLARIHKETMEELATVLSPDLLEELQEFASCCDEDGIPTEAEIRVAQAQLVGWLQGLLQGMQASMAAQHAAATQQLREITGAGGPGPQRGPQMPQQAGTYL